MKIDVVSVNSFQKKIDFAIPPLRVREELEKQYRDVGARARVAGFRKGKVPRKVLESKFGPRIQADVANAFVQEGYSNAVKEHGLEPVGRPQLSNAGEVRPDTGFSFTITVEIKPDVAIEKYTGVEVVYPSIELQEADVDRLVRSVIESRSKLEEVSGREVRKGDWVITELLVRDGDVEVARELGTMIRTDGELYYPGVESLLIGAAIGETREGPVKFSENARSSSVQGKELHVTAKVVSVQALQVPTLSDDLAKELGYEGGVSGMRETLKLRTQQEREPLARNQARANLLQALIAENAFEVPKGMVDDHLEMLLEELKLQQAYRTGKDPRRMSFSPDQIADLRVRAEFAAKGGIILQYVSKKESLEVTDADLESKYQEIADQRGQSIEAIRGYFGKESAVEELRARLLEEKTLDWLLERSKLVTPETPTAPAEKPVAEATVSEEAPKAKSKTKTTKAAPAEVVAEAVSNEEGQKPKAKSKAKATASAGDEAEAEAPKKTKAKAKAADESPAADAPKKKTTKKKTE